MNLKLTANPNPPSDIEIVERKGLGHPDSICDALAEQLSLALSAYYRDRFGLILHHNVDKVLLCAGEARPAYGGGKVVRPLDLFFAGRAVLDFHGAPVPVEDLAVEATQIWFRRNFHALDPALDLKVHVFIRPGSQDLTELFERQAKRRTWLANDTSCGVGFAPLTPTEQLTLEVERRLNSRDMKRFSPEIGQDVKIMSLREGAQLHQTIACALIDRHLADIGDYLAKKSAVASHATAIAKDLADLAVRVAVNTADDPQSGSVYLTVTGTSAEAGDDGEAGRGNRANGLITPHRPMTMESVAGKNPVTHVGKLYNLAAGLIAHRIVEEIPEIRGAQCLLVSQIGHPIADPLIADLRVDVADPRSLPILAPLIDRIVGDELHALDGLASALLAGDIAFDDWPFRNTAGASRTVTALPARSGLGPDDPVGT